MSTTTEQEKQPDQKKQDSPNEKDGKPQADGKKPDEGKNEEDKKMDPGKKRRIFLIAAVVLVIGAIAAVPIYFHYASIESTDDAQVDGHITPISARVGGTVIAVEVNDNEPVGRNKVLVRIDPRDYQVELERAQANLADAQAGARAAVTDVPITSTSATGGLETARAALNESRAAFETATNNIEVAQARVTSAEAQVREAQANYDKTAKDLERYRVLVAKDEISRQQYDAALADAERARATLEAARSAANEARQNVEVARSNSRQAQARIGQSQAQVAQASTVPQQIAATRARSQSAAAKVQQAEAAVRKAALDLSYTTLVAPDPGVVGRKAVEVGQIVQPGQQLMTLIPLDRIYITANFKETQLKEMRVGQPVDIKVDAYGGRKFRGHIDSLAPATGARFSLLPPENATGNYVKVVQRVPVKIVLEQGEDPDHILRPGLSVVPTVHVDVQPQNQQRQQTPNASSR